MELMEDLLELARFETGERAPAPRPLPLWTLLELIAREARAAYPGLVVDTAPQPGCLAFADPRLTVLVSLRLAAEACKLARGRVRLEAGTWADGAWIRIRDDGPVHDGHGMRLAVYDRLFRLQSGRVWMEAVTEDRGRFMLTLPAATAESLQSAGRGDDRAAAAGA